MSIRQLRRSFFATMIALLALKRPPCAQETPPDLSLGDLLQLEVHQVVGASRYEQSVVEAPSSISIITGDQIRRFGYRTLAEAIGSIKGAYITYDRVYHYLGLRGFSRPGDYNARFLLMVDGTPVNNPIYGSAGIGWNFPAPLDQIERIEVIRGPSSSLYGTSAFFGVINVITRDGKALQGPRISAGAGSFGAFDATAAYGNAVKNIFDGIIGGGLHLSQGPQLYFKEFDDPSMNNGISKNSDHCRAYQGYAKTRWGDVVAAGDFTYCRKGIPTGAWGTVFNDSSNQETEALGVASLKYQHLFPHDLTIKAEAALSYYHFIGEYVYAYAVTNSITGDTTEQGVYTNKDEAFGEEFSLRLEAQKRLFDHLRIIGGAEGKYSFRLDQKNFDKGYDPYMDERHDNYVAALYAQAEYRADLRDAGALTTNVGLRYDYYETFGHTINPRLALIYGPPWKMAALKILFGTAFRAPNAYEMYYNFKSKEGMGQKQNSDLNAEKIMSLEGVYEQYLGRNVRASAAVFYNAMKDLISQTIDPADSMLVFKNAQQGYARGAEVEVEARLKDDLTIWGSYTFQDAAEAQSGAWLTNSPKHMAKLGVSVPFWQDRIRISPEFQYLSPRLTLGGLLTAPAYLLNATLLIKHLGENRFLRHLSLSVSVYDMLDIRYGHPGAGEHLGAGMEEILQDGRTVRAVATYGF